MTPENVDNLIAVLFFLGVLTSIMAYILIARWISKK